MEIRLTNTMGWKKQVLKPLEEGKVGMYCCGPTVYNYAHIGNMRTYIFEDVLRRVLEYEGLKVNHVMNITDVGHLTSDADSGDDKLEVGAAREKKTVWEIAEFYAKAFSEDSRRLNILTPTTICRATDHIDEMIDLIEKLKKNGYTYATDDGIYYDTSKFKEYGKLAGMSFEGLIEKLRAGARVELSEQKRNITDFALWKFSPKDRKRQMEWDSPWGVGFPGWHTECSAMSMKYLGESFDVHCGGIDHIPTHHTNEIAQSEGATGKKFVNYWLHGAFLVMGRDVKMSKSLGNIIAVETLIENGFDPLDYRYLCLTSHYRSDLVFTWNSLTSARIALSSLRERIREMKDKAVKDKTENNPDRARMFEEMFLEAINDDLNMPKAMSTVWKLLKDDCVTSCDKINILEKFDKVLGLNLFRVEEQVPIEITELVRERENMRKAGDYSSADRLRERARELGYVIEDTSKGVKIRKA